ncbi:hypothetical protein BDR22DRAFT_974461 [Usnea florida]
MIPPSLTRMQPANQTYIQESTPTFLTSPSTMASLSTQQDSQWGPSGIGTVVFGLVASILSILTISLTIWKMFFARQRESVVESVELHRLDSEATASNDEFSLAYPPHDGEIDPEATEGSRGDAVADNPA